MYRKCPICGKKEGDILSNISMCLPEGYSLPASYDVVCCRKCGFTFADVNAAQKDYDDYYCNHNVYAEDAEIKHTDENMEQWYNYLYSLFRDKAGSNAKILDVGCGDGGFLCFLKDKEYTNLCGLDPSKDSILRLQKKGIRGIYGSIFGEPVQEEKASYDMVISTMVMEHVYDLHTYLSKVIFYLKKNTGAYLLLAVPAVEGFEKHICPVPNYFNHEHINYFSRMSMDNLLQTYSFYRRNDNLYFENKDGEIMLGFLYERQTGQGEFKKDSISGKSIKEYFNQVKIRESELRKKIDELLSYDKKFYIWGCGAYAMSVIKNYPLILDRMEAFIDNNRAKQGEELLGKKVLSPSVISDTEAVIAVCSMLNAGDIEKQIDGLAPECRKVIL